MSRWTPFGPGGYTPPNLGFITDPVQAAAFQKEQENRAIAEAVAANEGNRQRIKNERAAKKAAEKEVRRLKREANEKITRAAENAERKKREEQSAENKAKHEKAKANAEAAAAAKRVEQSLRNKEKAASRKAAAAGGAGGNNENSVLAEAIAKAEAEAAAMAASGSVGASNPKQGKRTVKGMREEKLTKAQANYEAATARLAEAQAKVAALKAIEATATATAENAEERARQAEINASIFKFLTYLTMLEICIARLPDGSTFIGIPEGATADPKVVETLLRSKSLFDRASTAIYNWARSVDNPLFQSLMDQYDVLTEEIAKRNGLDMDIYMKILQIFASIQQLSVNFSTFSSIEDSRSILQAEGFLRSIIEDTGRMPEAQKVFTRMGFRKSRRSNRRNRRSTRKTK